MNSAAHPATAVDPDEVLREHTRQLSGDYRARLADAYDDPKDTARRFYEEASRVGPADAAIRMRDDPAYFGALRDGGEPAARQAAVLGAKAYHSRVAEGEPKVGAAVLDQAITDRLQAVRGIDREQVRATWDALSRAYGPDRAAEVFTRRHRDVLGESMSPAKAEQLARFAAARDHLRARAGLLQAPTYERSAPLPRSLEEAGETGLPQGLQERLLAASDGVRKRLRAAYESPLAAEARLHQMVDEQGMDAIVAVHLDPSVLGPLRGDMPGGIDRARGLAASAMDHAEIAYGYHRARGAEEAERLRARDALDDARRGARDVERAMGGIQEAVQLDGPELQAHLDRQRERGIDKGDRAPRGPAHDGPGSNGGPGEAPGDRPEPEGRDRGVRDVNGGVQGSQEAVELHRPEPKAHQDGRRERGIDEGDGAPRSPVRDGPGPRGGPGETPGDRDKPKGRGRGAADGASDASAGPAQTGDPAVDAAVQAHMELEEARELSRRLRTLRQERRKAEEKLAELREQDAALTRARRDFRAVAAEMYRHPDAAIGKWQEIVAADGPERAGERLKKDPAILGELRTGPEPGPVRRAVRAAVRAWREAPAGEPEASTDPRSRLAARAEAFAQADAATRKPVEWTTPEGEKVVGREKVREAAQGVYDRRQREIEAGEKRLDKLGGVEGAEKAAQRSLDGLSTEQKEAAARQIAKRTGRSVLDVATGMARRTVETVRVVRTLGEGPAGL